MTEFIRAIEAPNGFRYRQRKSDGWYVAAQNAEYWSPRYVKLVKIKKDQDRDGATWALDIVSFAWWVHDQLCADGCWADGSDVSPWQAAVVLYDILRGEGRWFRARTWFVATLLLGCRGAWGRDAQREET